MSGTAFECRCELVGRSAVALAEVDRGRGLRSKSLNRRCSLESIASGDAELTFGEDVGDDGVDARRLAQVSSSEVLAWQ
jgi:hypothetical protein